MPALWSPPLPGLLRLISLAAAAAAIACGGDPCGNGEIENGEECDDGSGNSDASPCTSLCLLATCGDGFVLAGIEQCDDGPANADIASCTSTCEFARCGDGLLLESSEDCDEGTANADDGSCTSRCQAAYCGDGLVWSGHEQCDDGDANSDSAECTSTCVDALCGDGLLREGEEECDLGKANADDAACTSDCREAVCGDGNVHAGVEQCDDGNTLDGDACSSQCLFPTTWYLADADAKIIGEAAGDNAGYDIAGLGDVNGDGNDDVLVTASVNDGGGTDAGAAYLLHGPLVGPIDLSSADAKWTGEAGNNYLSYGRSAGDINGDGDPDLLLGAANDEGGLLAGAAYLVLGSIGGTNSVSEATAKLVGESTLDFAGSALAGVGDVDGDGNVDFLIGAYGRDDGGLGSGAAYLVLGPLAGTSSLSTADAKLVGENAGDLAGIAVSGTGDVDGDGLPDLLIGAPLHANAGIASGAAYLVLGDVRGYTDLGSADAKLVGESDTDNAGQSVAGGRDFDGDGAPDLLIGAPLDNEGGTDAGAAYVALGTTRDTVELADSHSKLVGANAEDRTGGSVSTAGDIDGDGAEDLIVGAHLATVDVDDQGGAYLVFGPIAGGTIDLFNAPATLLGESMDDLAGWRVMGAGDIDADGLDDVIVSSLQDDDGGVNAGAVYVMLGSSF